MSSLYFDAHATTPCDPAVVEAMLPFFSQIFGNAASRQHPFGWAAREALDAARADVAAAIGARPNDIIFTSGATESNNLAIKGAAEVTSARGRHIVTVVTEHRAVLDPCEWLARRGFAVTHVPVAPDGLVSPGAVAAALRNDTVLVSVMAANNEIGVLQPLEEIGRLTASRGIVFHTDAAQAVGKVPFDVATIQADLVSFTAHKLYGPKGIGALYVCRRGPAAHLEPLLHGGGHERGLRSGTVNVPGCVGFGVACRLAGERLRADSARLSHLRDRLLSRLTTAIDDVRVNGSMTARLPHNLNVTIGGVDGTRLLMALTDLGLSSGAACATVSAEPSHVLLALGLTEAEAKSSLRFGLLRDLTEDDIDRAAARVVEVVSGLRRNVGAGYNSDR